MTCPDTRHRSSAGVVGVSSTQTGAVQAGLDTRAAPIPLPASMPRSTSLPSRSTSTQRDHVFQPSDIVVAHSTAHFGCCVASRSRTTCLRYVSVPRSSPDWSIDHPMWSVCIWVRHNRVERGRCDSGRVEFRRRPARHRRPGAGRHAGRNDAGIDQHHSSVRQAECKQRNRSHQPPPRTDPRSRWSACAQRVVEAPGNAASRGSTNGPPPSLRARTVRSSNARAVGIVDPVTPQRRRKYRDGRGFRMPCGPAAGLARSSMSKTPIVYRSTHRIKSRNSIRTTT
jgi:hypothetical protein